MTLAQAEALMDVGRTDDAVRLLEDHLRRQPDDLEALCHLARGRLILRQSQLAMEAAQAALTLDPKAEWPLRLASAAAEALGRKKEAAHLAERAALIAPDAPASHQRMAYALSARGRHRRAWEAAMTAVSLAPDDPQAACTAGDVASAANMRKRAVREYERALSLAPDQASILAALGRVHLRRHRLIKATEALMSAARLEPTQVNADAALACIWWQVRRLAVMLVVISLTALFLAETEPVSTNTYIVPRWVVVIIALLAAACVVTFLTYVLARVPLQLLRISQSRVLGTWCGRLCAAALVVSALALCLMPFTGSRTALVIWWCSLVLLPTSHLLARRMMRTQDDSQQERPRFFRSIRRRGRL